MNQPVHRDPSGGLDEPQCLRLLDVLPMGVLVLEQGRVRWVNPALLELTQSSREDFLALDGTVSPVPRLSVLFSPEERILLPRPDGTTCWLSHACQDLEPLTPTAHFYSDITASVELERRCDALDPKERETGLLNRRAILDALDKQLTRSRRYENPLSLIRLTLRAPPETADRGVTLKALSQEFRARFRFADEMGRLDPDTFLFILPETPQDNAAQLAQSLTAERFGLADLLEGWQLSFAVAGWKKGDDARKLLGRLDQAAG